VEAGSDAVAEGARCSVLRVRALGSRVEPFSGSFSRENLENFIASASI
jgi:hypothetical protein